MLPDRTFTQAHPSVSIQPHKEPIASRYNVYPIATLSSISQLIDDRGHSIEASLISRLEPISRPFLIHEYVTLPLLPNAKDQRFIPQRRT